MFTHMHVFIVLAIYNIAHALVYVRARSYTHIHIYIRVRLHVRARVRVLEREHLLLYTDAECYNRGVTCAI